MKKFLSYVLTFLALFVISAAATVSLSSNGGSGSMYPAGGEQSNASSVFSSLLSAFQENQLFNIKGKLNVSYDDYDVEIEVYLDADIADSSDMKFDGLIAVNGGQNPRYLEFTYVDKTVFLSFEGNALKISNASIDELKYFIKEFTKSEEGSSTEQEAGEEKASGMDALLEKIDLDSLMPKLMSSLENIVETELEDGGRELEMNVEGLASLKITIDSEEKPSKAIIKTEEIEGVTVNADVSVNFDKGIIVSNPERVHTERDYIEFGNILSLVKNTISSNQLTAEANILYKNKRYDFNLGLDLGSSLFSVDALGKYAIRYLDGDLYVDADACRVKVGKSLLSKAPEIKDKLLAAAGENADLPSVDSLLGGLKDKLSAFDYVKILSSIKEISTSSHGVSLVADGKAFGLDGHIRIFIGVEEERLSSILVGLTYKGEYVELNATLSNSFKIEKPNDENYLDVSRLVESFENFDLSKGIIDLEANMAYAGKEYSLLASFKGSRENKRASLSLSLGGEIDLSLDAEYYGEDAYIRVGSAYIKVPKTILDNLLKGFTLGDEGLNKLTSGEQLGKLQDFVKDFKLSDLKLIKELRIDSSAVILTLDKSLLNLSSDLTLKVSLSNGEISSIEVCGFESGDMSLSAVLSISHSEPEFKKIDEEKYLDVDKLYKGIENLLNSRNTMLEGYVDLRAGELDGRVNLELRKKMEGQSLLGYALINFASGDDNIALTTNYFGNTLYAEVLGLKLKLGLGDLMTTAENIINGLGLSYDDYSNIITAAYTLLSGRGIISAVSGLTYQTTLPEMDSMNMDSMSFDINYLDIIKLLSNVEINSSFVNITLDSMFGIEGEVTLTINLENYMLKRAYLNGLEYKGNTLGFDLSFSYDEQEIPILTSEEREEYIDLCGLSSLVAPVYNTIAKGSISGEFTLEFDYKGEKNSLLVKYGVKLGKDGISAFIETEFKGLKINAYFMDNTLYLDIVGLNIYVHTSDIDDIKERLGIKDEGSNKTLDGIEGLMNAKTWKERIHALSTIDLSFINSARFSSGSATVTISEKFTIGVKYGEVINSLSFVGGGINVFLQCLKFDEVVLGSVDTNEYEKYTILFDTFDGIKKTLAEKEFKAHAEASSYVNKVLEDKATVNLDLDINNDIYASGDITVSGKDNIKIDFAFQNNTLYGKYENLKLKIERSGIAKLLAIACDLVGIDPGKVLGDDYSDVNLKSDAIKDIIPDFDMGNPLNMLYLIKSIDIVDGKFIIVLNGERINAGAKKDMTLQVLVDENGVKEIDLLNIYTAADKDKYFNFALTLGYDAEVTAITGANEYIDITDSPDLIEGLINTYGTKDIYLSGTIALKVIGIEGLVNVDMTAQIKLVDGKPKIAIELSNYPLINLDIWGKGTYGTGDNTNKAALGRKRSISIYYDNGFCYLKTYDPSYLGTAELTRETKVPYQTVFSNIEHYVKWLFGFTEPIMDEIRNAIEISKSQPIDVSNLLKSYSFDGTTHTIVINMEAITHDPNIGSLSVDFATVDRKEAGETRSKHYVEKIGIDLALVSVVEVKTGKSDPLTVDFNKKCDMNTMDSYISSFNNTKNPYREYWTEGSNVTVQNMNNYTLTLDYASSVGKKTLSCELGELVLAADNKFSGKKTVLPKLDDNVIDDGMTRTVYKFAGWYYENGEEFTEEFIDSDLTLVAHWKKAEEKKYYSVYLVDNLSGTREEKRVLEGERLSLETLFKAAHDDVENSRKVYVTYEHIGWTDGEATYEPNGQIIMRGEDISLSAVWRVNKTNYYTVSFDMVLPFLEKESITALEGEKITLEKRENYSYETDGAYYEYAFEKWLDENGDEVSTFTLDRDIKITAKWSDEPIDSYVMKTLTIYSVNSEGVSKFEGSSLQKVGERYRIAFDSALNIDAETRLYKTYSDRTKKYADLFEKASDGNYIMPEENLTLYISRAYTVNFTVREVKFSFSAQTKLYQGEDINFNDIMNYSGDNATLRDLKSKMQDAAKVYDTKNVDYYDYKFLYWVEDTEMFNLSVMPGRDINLVSNWDAGYLKYMRVVFNTKTNNLAVENNGCTTYDDIYFLRSIEIDLSLYQPTCHYKVAISYTRDFKGWKLNGANVSGKITLTSDATFEAEWGMAHRQK